MSPYAYDGWSRRSSQGRTYTGIWDDFLDRVRSNRSHHPRDSGMYQYSPTYGTYYTYADGSPASDAPHRQSPAPSRSDDSANCTCTCCPHECWKHRGSRGRRAADGGFYGGGGHSNDDMPSPYHSARRSSRSSYSVPRSGSSRSRSHNRERSSTRGLEVPAATVVSVHNHTDGPLWRRHGPVFTLSIPAEATMRDVLHTLTPTGGEKVLVIWDDGTREPLDRDVSLRMLRKHAAKLEVRNRKHVHWR